MKVISMKTSTILFLILIVFWLFGCEYAREEKYKLKQLVNVSTTTLHGSFLGSSSSS